MKDKKPKWWKPAIENKGMACLCCDTTTDILPLTTKLYTGFGGWCILKNGELFFEDDRDVEFEDFKDLQHVEELIGDDNENEYVARFDSPLRDTQHQRHAKNTWVLIEKGLGFA